MFIPFRASDLWENTGRRTIDYFSYQDTESDVRKGIRRILSLSFLPLHELDDVWEELKATFVRDLMPISDYLNESGSL